ncbi:MAG TPA: DNA-processing protein DprA [Puia sp.]|nr:DNA-processing protein DprA [Puia sp.]
MENDLLYQLALARVHGIGPSYARKLIRRFGNARAIFQADPSSLEEVCGPKNAEAIVHFDEFFKLEKEQAYLERYSMRCLFITDKDYPQRLLNYADAPILLFYKGNADLNAARVISVVGTRSPSEYGKQATEHLVKQLATCCPGLLIVSGLAYGIDGIAHQAALHNRLPTLGILGHGLDRIYPRQHAPLARQMAQQGGLLTQFSVGTEVEDYRFPMRNKLVAALGDALVVIETASRGGSLLTAGNALKYKKKVFALPGRINDPKSSGCNEWIRSGKATLLNDAGQMMEEMGWAHPHARPTHTQTSLFPSPDEITDLSENEKRLLYLFREKENLTHDELSAASQQFAPEMAMAMLNLELQGWIRSLPGKKYQLQL